MDTATALLLAAAALALGDWFAVALRWRTVELVLKPAVLALLVAVAAVSHVDGGVRWFLVVALGLGLVGDVAIMLASDERADGWFFAGVAAFLLGHAAYIAAFLRYGVHGWAAVGGALVALGVGGLVLPRAVAGASRQGGREVGVVVASYAVVIAVMAAAAAGTTLVLTAIGGAMFVLSDAVLSRERFVTRWSTGRVPAGELVVIATYHAAQALILLGFLRESWLR